MPFRNREIFQLGVLLLCVPVQYLFTSYIINTTGRSQALFDVINDLKEVKELLFSAESWKQRWDGLVSSLVQVYFPELSSYTRSYVYNEQDTSPAIEVMRYDKNAGYFGMGTEVRYERPSHLRFRIGQVVRHRRRGYRAVIVGWDLIAKQAIPSQLPICEQVCTLKYGQGRTNGLWVCRKRCKYHAVRLSGQIAYLAAQAHRLHKAGLKKYMVKTRLLETGLIMHFSLTNGMLFYYMMMTI